MLASHSTKNAVRYRYYVSRSLLAGASDDGLRLPAREIEQAVKEQVAHLFDDPLELASRLSLEVSPSLLHSLSGRCRALAAALRSRTGGPLSDIAFCVQAGGGKLVIALSPARIAGVLGMPEPGDAPPLTLDVAYRLTRTGRAVRLVQADGSSPHGEPNTALVNLVVEARRLWTRLSEGDTDVAALAKETGRNGSYITRIVRAAFLAPQVVDAILAGRQHGALTARMLKDSGGIPPRWKDQAARYLPHSNSGASV